MDEPTLVGDWDIGLREFTILSGPDGLVMRFPESEPGFEGRLRRLETGRYVIEGGAYPGAELLQGEDGWSVGGVFPLTRIDRPAQPQPGSGIRCPAIDLDADEDEGCRALWNRIDHPSRLTDLDLGGMEIHRFVQWLMLDDRVIFHGSNNAGLAHLTPVRRSMELMNTGGRGNHGAVYGTHDGLWSMFFAVIDREQLHGSIRNGVDRHFGKDGAYTDLYHFSIHHEMLDKRPFTTGALYLLPRQGFERLPLYPGGPPSNEWACRRTVTPLARLLVRPEDFPFLEAIGGHDDGALIQFELVADAVYDGVVSARAIPGGVEIVTTADADDVGRFVELSRQFFPDVDRVVSDQPGQRIITMTGPDAFEHGIRRRFADLIGKLPSD
ncbi:MAG TPA: hypothetical protein VJ938_14700 [Acidimicrobiia bacterium]|nr:hypothetical protein [Acidimicrobiia bacterium]